MSQIKPYSSFTNATAYADFPACKLLLHMDDVTAGDTTWTDRISGRVFTFSGALSKDSEGVHADGSNVTVSSISGTMPTLAGYSALAIIGKPTAASTTTGLSCTIGDGTTGAGIIVTGLCYTTAGGNTARNTAPTVSAITTAGKLSARAAYWDMVDSSSPIIASAISNNYDTATGTSAGTGTTTDTLAVNLGGVLSSASNFTALTGNTGARLRMLALFDFTAPLSTVAAEVNAQMATAVSEMARTRELFAGWRNRA